VTASLLSRIDWSGIVTSWDWTGMKVRLDEMRAPVS
jgi:hypothetical protein